MGEGEAALERRRVAFAAETAATVADAEGRVRARSTQTQFSIDIDKAPQLIASLEQAIEKLLKAYRDAEELTKSHPPGKDIYSGFAAMAMRKAAGDEEGGYRWANEKAREALQKTIDNIKAAVAGYRRTEGVAHDAFTGQGDR
ncbi:hypothetical protein GCM10022243_12850 [Saccharothrix violaceirubra]|uniref:Excreted virulence factor EspC (Type VII ESX diderm) n=1 Tax=Saccharothrix violaceirubra TaxID=413306 RepID=A0A7W7T6L0_9PSEU|nr:hypothetical protein [Saccharothrix violaceirubra]MBB4967524.1 hypothetical protein [Saccharothrix violaceirubra]